MLFLSMGPTRPRSSAGRATAKLLLSFLALSPLSVVTASPDPIPPPLRATALPDDIFGPGPVIGGGSGEGGAGGGEGRHTFVGVPKLCRVTQSSGKLGTNIVCSLYATYFTMELICKISLLKHCP